MVCMDLRVILSLVFRLLSLSNARLFTLADSYTENNLQNFPVLYVILDRGRSTCQRQELCGCNWAIP